MPAERDTSRSETRVRNVPACLPTSRCSVPVPSRLRKCSPSELCSGMPVPSASQPHGWRFASKSTQKGIAAPLSSPKYQARSEEHTSELQSLRHLVCRLLLEKKKQKKTHIRQYKQYTVIYKMR